MGCGAGSPQIIGLQNDEEDEGEEEEADVHDIPPPSVHPPPAAPPATLPAAPAAADAARRGMPRRVESKAAAPGAARSARPPARAARAGAQMRPDETLALVASKLQAWQQQAAQGARGGEAGSEAGPDSDSNDVPAASAAPAWLAPAQRTEDHGHVAYEVRVRPDGAAEGLLQAGLRRLTGPTGVRRLHPSGIGGHLISCPVRGAQVDSWTHDAYRGQQGTSTALLA
jgi:hypothetical protein